MSLESFKRSDPLTLGVELELQLVSLSDFDLTRASSDMLELLNRSRFPGNVVPEITESMLESFFAQMERTGVVKSMKDFYWDIRPKPEYGTIELRVCDTPLTVERAAALAGYLQVLCAFLRERGAPPPAESDYLVYTYNRFQACRFGLDGTLVDPKHYQSVGLREDIEASISRLRPLAAAHGAEEALDHVMATVRTHNDATLLRRERDDSGSMEAVVNAALRAFRT